MRELAGIIRKEGFDDVLMLTEEVSDEYARKWGYGMGIKEWIQKTYIMGRK